MTRARALLLAGFAAAAAATLAFARPAGHATLSRPAQGTQAPAFAVDVLWPKPMPNHWILGSATGVAVDSRDHIYVLNITTSFNARTEIGAAQDPPTGECCAPAPAVLEFDVDGNLVGHFGGPGQGYDWPESPSGIAVDDKGNVWIGGSAPADGQVLEFSRDGKFVRQIGKPNAAAVAARRGGSAAGGSEVGLGRAGRGGRGRGRGRGGPPVPPPPGRSTSMDDFGGVAHLAVDNKAGEVFVADGYRNRRVAVLDLATGKIKRYWGAYGNAPSDAPMPHYDPAAAPSKQFDTVHCAVPSADGLVYVCDRGNDRIQVFREDGSFVKEKRLAPATLGAGSVWDIAFSRDPQQRFLYVADGMNMQVHILDRQSLDELVSFGDGGRQPGEFYALHSIATDSHGNIYTTETLEGKRVQKFVYKGLAPVTAKNRGVVWPDR